MDTKNMTLGKVLALPQILTFDMVKEWALNQHSWYPHSEIGQACKNDRCPLVHISKEIYPVLFDQDVSIDSGGRLTVYQDRILEGKLQEWQLEPKLCEVIRGVDTLYPSTSSTQVTTTYAFVCVLAEVQSRLG